MAGYSGTPLANKLNLEPGLSYWPINASESLFSKLGQLDEMEVRTSGQADLVHPFNAWRD